MHLHCAAVTCLADWKMHEYIQVCLFYMRTTEKDILSLGPVWTPSPPASGVPFSGPPRSSWEHPVQPEIGPSPPSSASAAYRSLQTPEMLGLCPHQWWHHDWDLGHVNELILPAVISEGWTACKSTLRVCITYLQLWWEYSVVFQMWLGMQKWQQGRDNLETL